MNYNPANSTGSSFRPTQHKHKSFGKQVKEYIITWIIVSIVCYFIEQFFAFLFSPFKKAVGGNTREYIEARQNFREQYLEAVAQDVTDPMYQFQDRFIDHPENYIRNKDNKTYKTWFDNWKKGLVIDSGLRWAPDMYTSDDSIRMSFLDYMKIQLNLHKKASYLDKRRLMKTLREFYPEFTATLRGLENDLARYEALVTEEELKATLAKEIKKFGLPESVAKELAEKDLDVDELRKEAEAFKVFSSKGFSNPTCLCAVENGLTEDEAKVIEHVVVKMELPARVGLAFLRDELNTKNLSSLYEMVMESREALGSDMFTVREGDTDTYWNVYIDELLSVYRSEKRARKYA
jgi:hypothetical protein